MMPCVQCLYMHLDVCRNFFIKSTREDRGARWLSGRASDSGARGREFETYLRRVVSLNKIFYSPKVLVIPRKRWLRPDMTKIVDWGV